MRKRNFLATAVTLALCAATLVGCGSSDDSSAAGPVEYETAPAEYAESADNESVDQAPAEYAETDDDWHGLADVTGENDDFGQVPEDEQIPWDDEYAEQEVEGETVGTTEAGKAEGIIVLQVDYKTNSFAPTFTVSAINPQTGDSHMVSSFVFEHVARVQEKDFLVEPAYEQARYFNYRDLFNEDFTLVAATKTFLNNEEKHAGWMDQSGNFFDVTEALGEGRQSDFDEAKHYKALGFTPDGNFAYADVEDQRHPVYYMVPLDNITPGESYQVNGDTPYIMDDYSDAWNWRRTHYQTCWINDDQFLAVTYHDSAMSCVCITVSSQAIEQIVPSGSQTSWSPVLGPDGASIAFMSAPAEGTDNPAIYLTDINGAAPTKLKTTYTPLCGRLGDGGSVLYNISPAYYYASVLEWK